MVVLTQFTGTGKRKMNAEHVLNNLPYANIEQLLARSEANIKIPR